MSAEPVPTVSGDRVPRLPLTIGQVARFAAAPFGRVMALIFGMALAAGFVVAHFVAMSWWPAVRAAAAATPDGIELRSGRLLWPTNAVQALAENRFLAILAVPRGTQPLPTAADVTLELREDGVDAASLLGYTFIRYPHQVQFRLTSRELGAQLDAWHPQVLAWVGILAFLGLSLAWLFGGLLLALPLLSYSLLGERRATFFGCWRLAIAGFVPGTVVILIGVLLYTYQQVALVELLLVAGGSLLITVLLLVVAPLKLPPAPSPKEAETESGTATDPESPESDDGVGAVANPFAERKPQPSRNSGNPFAGSGRRDGDVES